MPDQFCAEADAAIERHKKRGFVPKVIQGRKAWHCPYADEDLDRWTALLFEVFGTRQSSVVDAFFAQLTEIGEQLHRKRHEHTPGRWELSEAQATQMLAIMRALKPEDEAQAAYAAQLVALHLSAMKLATATAKTWGGDPKTAAVLNKTVNAYGLGMERMARLQGKAQARTTHQTIEVTYNDNRQAVLLNGGVGSNDGQPHGAAAYAPLERAALPSSQSGGESMRSASGKGQASLPGPWWGQRLWRALWAT